MSWTNFLPYAAAAIALWIGGAVQAFRGRRGAALVLSGLGTALLLAFIAGLWATLQRPPLRTMGETRLWYAFFLTFFGAAVYARHRYAWLLALSATMATVFTLLNLLRPELHEQALMPALQSPWFVPHVIVYMMAYALLGAAALWSAYLWLRLRRHEPTPHEMHLSDMLVRLGWCFLTLGMTMGALWAKQAWGDYWTWDPKETWAAATWLAYLLYLHQRAAHCTVRTAFVLNLLAFLLLQMCWYGIHFLPSAAGMSAHTYS